MLGGFFIIGFRIQCFLLLVFDVSLLGFMYLGFRSICCFLFWDAIISIMCHDFEMIVYSLLIIVGCYLFCFQKKHNFLRTSLRILKESPLGILKDPSLHILKECPFGIPYGIPFGNPVDPMNLILGTDHRI